MRGLTQRERELLEVTAGPGDASTAQDREGDAADAPVFVALEECRRVRSYRESQTDGGVWIVFEKTPAGELALKVDAFARAAGVPG
jgi:hypothetical protein